MKFLPATTFLFSIIFASCSQQNDIVMPVETSKPIDVQALLKDKIDRTRNWHHYTYSRRGSSYVNDTLNDTAYAFVRINDTAIMVPTGTILSLDSVNSNTIVFFQGWGYPGYGSHSFTIATFYYKQDSIVWERSSGGLGGGGSNYYITN